MQSPHTRALPEDLVTRFTMGRHRVSGKERERRNIRGVNLLAVRAAFMGARFLVTPWGYMGMCAGAPAISAPLNLQRQHLHSYSAAPDESRYEPAFENFAAEIIDHRAIAPFIRALRRVFLSRR